MLQTQLSPPQHCVNRSFEPGTHVIPQRIQGWYRLTDDIAPRASSSSLGYDIYSFESIQYAADILKTTTQRQTWNKYFIVISQISVLPKP